MSKQLYLILKNSPRFNKTFKANVSRQINEISKDKKFINDERINKVNVNLENAKHNPISEFNIDDIKKDLLIMNRLYRFRKLHPVVFHSFLFSFNAIGCSITAGMNVILEIGSPAFQFLFPLSLFMVNNYYNYQMYVENKGNYIQFKELKNMYIKRTRIQDFQL